MATDIQQLFKQLYSKFDPTRPLEVGDPTYIDCQSVRGDVNTVDELSREILLAADYTCQLYTGHRGCGKSTELKRLIHDLQQQDYQVIYFDTLEDIDPEDARYADILIACTRRLLEKLKGNEHPVKQWFTDRSATLKELAMATVVTGDSAIGFFAQLTANLKVIPTERHKIRQRIEPHTVSLLQALNEFISSACSDQSKIVLIADGLDRIVPITDENKRINHDEIFLDHSGQLRGLKCHVIYTVPISMLYSGTANHLDDRYGRTKVLPMVTVRERGSRQPCLAGINVFKELIVKRIAEVLPNGKLTDVFADENIVTTLCLTSGGNVRELVHLMHNTLHYAPLQLPVPLKAVQRAIAESREVYRRMISADHWELLAQVYVTQSMPNSDEYRKLLYNRCILEYRQIDADQNITTWHDVHPLIAEAAELQAAVRKISEGL